MLMIVLIIISIGLCRGDSFDGIKSIKELNTIMENHFARENTLSAEEFNNRLPSDNERKYMRQLINILMIQKDLKICTNSSISSLFPVLEGTISLTPFQDQYCVIHEPIPSEAYEMFPRTFGYGVIRIPSNDVMNVHHSVAHFESDGGVTEQSATLFESTKSRTLMNNGISRFAIVGNPDSTCQPGNTAADAAHNTNMMFHTMLQGVYDVSKSRIDDHHIQWHGMAETSCLQSSAFVSLGASGSNSIYNTDNVADQIAKSITRTSNGKIIGNTPKGDETCTLVAGTNVFGRQVHGVPEDDVCGTAATKFDNKFIHIEQKMCARIAFDQWTETLNEIFGKKSIFHDEFKV